MPLPEEESETEQGGRLDDQQYENEVRAQWVMITFNRPTRWAFLDLLSCVPFPMASTNKDRKGMKAIESRLNELRSAEKIPTSAIYTTAITRSLSNAGGGGVQRGVEWGFCKITRGDHNFG